MANCPAKDLYFVHIPKNAGSSIEEVGLDHGIKWGKEFFNQKLYKFFLNGKLVSLAHWHLPYGVRKYDREPDKCFCVVRNPYEKIVSSYNYHSRNFAQIQKLNENYPDGLRRYVENARRALAASRDGVNPLQDCTPHAARSVTLEVPSDDFLECEQIGMEHMKYLVMTVDENGKRSMSHQSATSIDSGVIHAQDNVEEK